MNRLPLAELSGLITKGTTPTTLGMPFSDGGVPFLRAQNLVNGTVSVEADPLFISFKTHDALKRSSIEPGDVLISIAGTIGRAAVVPDDAPQMNCNQAVAIVRTQSRLYNRYLLHWLGSADAIEQISRSSVTGVITNLSLSQIARLTIPLPSLSEQKRLAAVLDAAIEVCTKRRSVIARLDDLTQFTFIEMFGDPASNPKGWPMTTIGELLESATYGTSSKAGSEGRYPILRMNNLTPTGRMDLADLKYINLDDKDANRYSVREGDILFNRTNSAELVGKTAVYDGPEPMIYAGYLVRLRVNERARPAYISAFLNSRYGKATLRGMCKSIVGMANINASEVQTIRLPHPPIELQSQFSDRLRATDEVRAKHVTASAKSDELFSSVQQRAFRGEL